MYESEYTWTRSATKATITAIEHEIPSASRPKEIDGNVVIGAQTSSTTEGTPAARIRANNTKAAASDTPMPATDATAAGFPERRSGGRSASSRNAMSGPAGTRRAA